MPCKHAVAAIAYKNGRAEDYCHGWLTMSSIAATYAHHVNPLQGEQYWAHSDQTPPLPPPIKKGPGRPKKNRRKDGNIETRNDTKLKRRLAEFTCSACGGKNHNKLTCPVLKKQRIEEFKAQSSSTPSAENGPPHQNGPNSQAETVTTHGAQNETPLASTDVGPIHCGPEEIDLSQSQPPPIIQSPSKMHTMLTRSKQPIRKAPPPPRQTSPPPAAPTQQGDDSGKAYQFMPTPGMKKKAP